MPTDHFWYGVIVGWTAARAMPGGLIWAAYAIYRHVARKSLDRGR